MIFPADEVRVRDGASPSYLVGLVGTALGRDNDLAARTRMPAAPILVRFAGDADRKMRGQGYGGPPGGPIPLLEDELDVVRRADLEAVKAMIDRRKAERCPTS